MFLAVCMLLTMLGYGAETVLYAENFDSLADGATIEQAGWKIGKSDANCTFVVANKSLRISCTYAKALRGGFAEINIPLCRRGMLEFDLLNDHDKSGIGLFLDLYNITTFWHEYCGDWRRYFPEPVARRLDGFQVEPVGHRRLAPVTKRQWNHYRILFDKDRDRVEYFINDMQDPAFIDGLAATRRIRSLPGMGKVPIVAVSAHDSADFHHEALEAGCDAYITKPIDYAQVEDTVKRLLAKKS